MDVKVFRTFLEVARVRHFGRAAENLYLTQAQDAVLTKQASVYFTALSQANDLVNAYFKLDQPLTKSTVKALDELSKESLQFKHDIALTSTEQVKEWAK